MSTFTIRNSATGEIIALARDTSRQHPAWVHEQCETSSESELQDMLSQYREDECVGKGRDTAGIEMTA